MKEKKINIQRSSSYPEVPSFAKAAHSVLDASIYRFSNDGPHFKVEIVDLQKFWPNRLFCHDIENSVAT